MVDLSDLGVEYEQLLEVFRIRKICEDIASWMINEKCSLRMCAKELGYSKSTIHKYIHTYRDWYVCRRNWQTNVRRTSRPRIRALPDGYPGHIPRP